MTKQMQKPKLLDQIGRLERKVNNELDNDLSRIKTIFDYYKCDDNKDRLVNDNIYYLKDICQAFFSVRGNFKNKYGMDIGMYEEKRIGKPFTEDSKLIKYLPDNKTGINIISELLDDYSNLYKVVADFQERINILLKNKQILDGEI